MVSESFNVGTTSVKCCILKDSHVFTTHILDPREDPEDQDQDVEETMATTDNKSSDVVSEENNTEQEKGEREKSEKEGMIDARDTRTDKLDATCRMRYWFDKLDATWVWHTIRLFFVKFHYLKVHTAFTIWNDNVYSYFHHISSFVSL